MCQSTDYLPVSDGRANQFTGTNTTRNWSVNRGIQSAFIVLIRQYTHTRLIPLKLKGFAGKIKRKPVKLIYVSKSKIQSSSWKATL